MEFTVNHMTPALFGQDTSTKTGARLKALGCTKVLFVYDHGVKKTGMPEKIMANVKEAGISVVVYEGVLADPPDYIVDAGAEIGRREQVDGIVGIGGGSTMDTAKAINILMTNPGSVTQYMQPGAVTKPGKVLILLPTTSGTGSEVTSFAVLTDSKTHSKKGLGGPNIRATLAIIDPVLTLGMPPSITADTGMDVVAHAVEAITANRANPMSDLLGENAIALSWKYLPKAVKDGKNIEARTQMSFAAMAAGYSFTDSMTHLGHAFGHTLGAMYHIPHGNACGAVLPEVVVFVADAMPEGVKLIGRAMGLRTGARTSAADAAIKVRDALSGFCASIGQKTLRQLNVPEAAFPQIAEAVAGPGPAGFSPKKPSIDDVMKMLRQAYVR